MNNIKWYKYYRVAKRHDMCNIGQNIIIISFIIILSLYIETCGPSKIIIAIYALYFKINADKQKQTLCDTILVCINRSVKHVDKICSQNVNHPYIREWHNSKLN